VDLYQRIFGVRTLSGIVEAFAKEQRNNTLFQSKFAAGRPLLPDGDIAEWDEVQMHRHLAPVVGRDSPFPLLEHTTRINRTSSMMHIKLSKKIPAAKLFSERAPGDLRADAQAVIDLELRDMVKVIMNTVEYASAQSLNGTLTVNSTNIPGSSQVFTVTYSTNTYTASNSWATASTGLLSAELPALVDDCRQTSGLEPQEIICGREIAGYVYGNSQVVNLLQSPIGGVLAQTNAARQGPAWGNFRLGDLNWQVSIGGYVPQGGSFTKFMPATDAFFCLPGAEDLPNVLGMALGYGFVPGDADVGPATPQNAANMVARAPSRGFYAYATRTINPVGIELFVGWVGLPVVLFPSGVCVGDAVP
jgi:hypothetical protein